MHLYAVRGSPKEHSAAGGALQAQEWGGYCGLQSLPSINQVLAGNV